MKGNFHDQFLEGWVGAIPPGYSASGETYRKATRPALILPKSPGAEYGVCSGGHEEARRNLIYPGGSGVWGDGVFRPVRTLAVDAPGDASESHDVLALG